MENGTNWPTKLGLRRIRSMWAVTSYYNPVRYKRRLSNYKIFRANLCVPLVTVELSFDGQFELTEKDADILIQISGGAMLWQKERLLNVALRSVPLNAKFIAWIDCDILFYDPDWVKKTISQLQDNNVAQLYSDMIDLSPDEDSIRKNHDRVEPAARSVVACAKDIGQKAFEFRLAASPSIRSGVNAGLAWAARAELLRDHEFYDAMIVGSGTRAMALAIFGRFDEVAARFYLNEVRYQHYLKWARPYHNAVRQRVGYVDSRICHLWHGDLGHRKKQDRHRMFAKFDFDPNADIRIGESGQWEWSRPRPELIDFFKDYFISRAEDGAPLPDGTKDVKL
jgi:hypothetical protein